MPKTKFYKPLEPENLDSYATKGKEIEKNKRTNAEDAYNKSYQNILWIDDMVESKSESKEKRPEADNNVQGEYDKIEWMKKYFKQPKLHPENNITLINTFDDAVKKIVEEYSKFDLVIFDMDLNKGISKEIPENIKEIFKKHNIILEDNTFENEDNKKAAGMWLYFLLLSVGYPLNRMIIYTGNGKGPIEKLSLFKESPLKFEFIRVDKGYNSLDIEKYFSGPENSYYRVRRLIFQADNYWNKRYKRDKKKKSEIPFNTIYKLNIPFDSFKEMLEHVKMMFPVLPPYEEEKREKIYYEAARAVSSFHETRATIKILETLERKKFHQTVRYFRNWSAHNKFKETLMSADCFVVFFCIALRTYFVMQDQYGEKLPYEDTYFNYTENKESKLEEEDELKKKLEEYFDIFFKNTIKEDFSKVNLYDLYDVGKHDKFKLEKDDNGSLISNCFNLDEFIRRVGELNTSLLLKYIFFSVLDSEKYEIELKCKHPEKHADENQSGIYLEKSLDFDFKLISKPEYESVSNYEKEFFIRIYNCIKKADHKR